MTLDEFVAWLKSLWAKLWIEEKPIEKVESEKLPEREEKPLPSPTETLPSPEPALQPTTQKKEETLPTTKPAPTGYQYSTRKRLKIYVRTKDGGTYTALCETACGKGVRSGTCAQVLREGDTVYKTETLATYKCVLKVS